MSSLLRRQPAFRRLWLAGGISLVGDWLSFVAVSAMALGSGGGPLALAVVFAAHALPAALGSPLAGALVDRIDRRRALVGADLAATVVTAAMALAAAAGQLVTVQVLLLIRSALTSIVPPGESAALRRLVPDADLVAANAILAATWSLAYVVGMALGGAAALLGPTLALALDAATFAAAAALHASLPAMPVERVATGGVWALVRGTPADTTAALRVAAADRRLLAAVLGKAPMALATGAGWIAINLIGAAELPFGPAALSFGVLQAIRGAGTGLGPALATRLIARGAAAEPLNQLARVAVLVGVLALTWAHGPLALGAVALVWGVGSGTNWVLCHVALQRHAPDAVLGRLAAFDELLVTVAMVVGAFAGALATQAGGPAWAPVVGAVLAGLALAGAALVVRRQSVPAGVE